MERLGLGLGLRLGVRVRDRNSVRNRVRSRTLTLHQTLATSEDQALELAVVDAHAPHVAAQRHLLELELVQPHGRWAA